MMQTGSILLGTIMVYILLSIARYYIIFSEVNNFAVSRTVLGVMGALAGPSLCLS